MMGSISRRTFSKARSNAAGEVVLRRRLKRGQVEKFFAKLPKAVIRAGGVPARRITGGAC